MTEAPLSPETDAEREGYTETKRIGGHGQLAVVIWSVALAEPGAFGAATGRGRGRQLGGEAKG